MEKMSFSLLRTSGLSINNVFSLVKSSVDISVTVQSYLGEMVNAALAKLIADNEKFGEQINKNQKSGLTDELKPLDKERDDVQYEINRDITYHLKGSDVGKKAAAQTLKLFHRHVGRVLNRARDQLWTLTVPRHPPIPVKHAHFEVVTPKSLGCLPGSFSAGLIPVQKQHNPRESGPGAHPLQPLDLFQGYA